MSEPTFDPNAPVPADQLPADPAAPVDQSAEIAQLKAEIAQLEAERNQPAPALSGEPAAAPAPSHDFDDWPTKGYSGDQPWDNKALGLEQQARELADDPGAPNNVSPVVVRAGLPMLIEGSQGEAVRELAVNLAALGYPTTVTRGENPYNILDASISEAVSGFRRDYGVEEDPSAFARDPRNNAISHIGPWTQEAIIRAADREKAAA